jgi:hypothetical protein
MNKLTLYKKLIKYRKILLINKIKLKNLDKYILICDFNHFNNLALKLLKLHFLSANINTNLFKPYKNIFNKFIFNSKYKFNKNNIFFKFNDLKLILNFIENLKELTIIPFLVYPLFLINNKKNIMISLKNLDLNYFNKFNNLKLFIYSHIIIILKKLIINFFFKITIKIKKWPL